MPEENKVTNEPKKTSGGKSGLIIAGIVLLALAIIFGLYFGLAYILRKANEGTEPTATTTTTTSGKLSDQNLVGTWESECLVPDPNSKWAEKHSIAINKDGTATHTRLSWDLNDCTTLDSSGKIVTQYKLTTPSAGKINFTVTGYENSMMDAAQAAQMKGATIYDIYQVTGNTLKFGHGFRGDQEAYGDKSGSSENDRFDTLNDFIAYKKQ
ncbi:MAG: hypothetical protein A2Y57_00780 [Candidatus Woykebacteria bacterium RBG_13_40_7b]|uniref:Uncharacterized protein n=1 Tax=Candidatus Woykebacteria bacterium RBG_13_40_7b TaxID=1802594 RepID=A0A1G1WAJ1_9BACT|nr:MAG: hypothetical protein A2Y57_00780 [Candidatus Woykebacteria bacterium RBG_13_40_7b]